MKPVPAPALKEPPAERASSAAPDVRPALPLDLPVAGMLEFVSDEGKTTKQVVLLEHAQAAVVAARARGAEDHPGVLEQIARQWDGCMFDARSGSDIDIGEAIRTAGIRLSRTSQDSLASLEARAQRLVAFLEDLRPLTAYGRVGTRDIDQQRLQQALANAIIEAGALACGLGAPASVDAPNATSSKGVPAGHQAATARPREAGGAAMFSLTPFPARERRGDRP